MEKSPEGLEGIGISASRAKQKDAAQPVSMPARVCDALILLLESSEYAADLGESPWEFAVECRTLQRMSLTTSDFRWLVRKRLVEHAEETTLVGEWHRSFRRGNSFVLSSKTCFVLTEKGLEFTRRAAAAPQEIGRWPDVVHREAFAQRSRNVEHPASCVPTWDRDRQELRLGGQLIKQFKVPATNQETILAAFEEEHWPARIDDPLPPQPELDAKRRLHDTINSLNRNQKQSLLRFFGDGSGQGIRWELLDNSSVSNRHEAGGG